MERLIEGAIIESEPMDELTAEFDRLADDSEIVEGMKANEIDIVIPETSTWNPAEIHTDYRNTGTFDEVFTELFPRVYNHASYELWRLGMNKDLAQEVVHIAAEKAKANWDKYTQGTYALAWFKRIVTNTCFNLRRKNNTLAAREVLIGIDHAEFFDKRGYQSESAEKQAIESIRFEELKSLFEALPPDQRDATKAVILDGMRTDEAAEYLGIKSATLLTRVHRGRTRLREMISQQRLTDKEI